MNEFLREEYLALRKEIELTLVEYKELERNCVVAVAFAYSWIATRSLDANIGIVAWLVPLLVPVYGWTRNRALNDHLRVVSTYIQSVEKIQAAETGVTGWETHLKKYGKKNLSRASEGFWVMLIVSSCLIAGIGIVQSLAGDLSNVEATDQKCRGAASD